MFEKWGSISVLLLVIVKLGILVGFRFSVLTSVGLTGLSVVLHFFKTLGISRAYEVCLHVVDSALRVHQVLLVLTFNLDHSHHNSVNHVDGLPLFLFLLTVYFLLVIRLRVLILELFLFIFDLHSYRMSRQILVVCLSVKLLLLCALVGLLNQSLLGLVGTWIVAMVWVSKDWVWYGTLSLTSFKWWQLLFTIWAIFLSRIWIRTKWTIRSNYVLNKIFRLGTMRGDSILYLKIIEPSSII